MPIRESFDAGLEGKRVGCAGVKKSRNLYRDNQELPDKEQQLEVHHDRPTILPGRLDIKMAKAFYLVEIMGMWT